MLSYYCFRNPVKRFSACNGGCYSQHGAQINVLSDGHKILEKHYICYKTSESAKILRIHSNNNTSTVTAKS